MSLDCPLHDREQRAPSAKDRAHLLHKCLQYVSLLIIYCINFQRSAEFLQTPGRTVYLSVVIITCETVPTSISLKTPILTPSKTPYFLTSLFISSLFSNIEREKTNMTDSKNPLTNPKAYSNGTALQKVLLSLQSQHPKSNIIENLTNTIGQHVSFFSRSASHPSLIYPWETYASSRALGFNTLISLFMVLDFTLHVGYPTSEHLVPVSWVMKGCPVYVERIARAKHGSDTGCYSRNGEFDEAAFARIWEFDG